MDKCCATCRYCAELKRPYERSDGTTIYGYCFKSGDKDYYLNMGRGIPIWLELTCGASCKSYKRAKEGRG